MRVLIWMSIGCTFIIQSCDIFRNDDLNPVFLDITDINLVTEPGEGANTHNIRDAWIIANGQDVGVFELPVRVPLLEPQPIDVRVFAGIRRDGQQNFPIEYPFFDVEAFTIEDPPGSVVSKAIDIKYRSTTKFEMIADFDINNPFNQNADDFDGSYMDVGADDLIDGNNAGVIYVDQDNPVCEVSTGIPFTAEGIIGQKPYLELDYRGNAPIAIGVKKFLLGNLFQTEYIIILKESEEWNHLYLSLEEFLSEPDIEEYRIVLNVDIEGLDVEEAYCYVDNVKLLRF